MSIPREMRYLEGEPTYWLNTLLLFLGGPVSPPASSHPERVQEQAEDEGQLGGVEEVLNGEAICHVGEGAVVDLSDCFS